MPTKSKAVAKKGSKVVKGGTKKISKKDGVTLNCFDEQTVVPREGLSDNVGRFAKRMGLGAYSVYSSPSSNASGMNDSQIENYSGAELWITERNKAS